MYVFTFPLLYCFSLSSLLPFPFDLLCFVHFFGIQFSPNGGTIDSGGSRPGGKVEARSQTFCFCPFTVLVFYGILVALVQK